MKTLQELKEIGDLLPRVINNRKWEEEEFPEEIRQFCSKSLQVLLTGSRYIYPTGPYVDTDIMLLLEADSIIHAHIKDDQEWVVCGNPYDNDIMIAYRKGEFNLLFTSDKSYFDRWSFATHLAIELRLQHKADRAFLFAEITNSAGYTFI